MTGRNRPLLLQLALALFIPGCDQLSQSGYQGYAEGDYMYLSAPYPGYLQSLNVERGSRVKTDKRLFQVSTEPERFLLAEADAQIAAQQATIRNLQQPRRQAEIDAKQAKLQKSLADLAFSEAQLRRMQALVEKGFVSKEGLDDARATRDRNAALVDEARDQLALYRITLGREPEIQAADAELQAAEARSEQKRWQLDTKTVSAPAEGEVTDIYYRPGEWIPAGQPVLSFLPDRRRLIRFFVPETELAGVNLGQTVMADCDGCQTPVKATITFISPRVEYTPPVIYSADERAKLVFRVEATPSPADAARLHPGLPMTVQIQRESS